MLLKRAVAITVLSMLAWAAGAEAPTRIDVQQIRMTGNRTPWRVDTAKVSMTGNRNPVRIDPQAIRMTGNRGLEEE